MHGPYKLGKAVWFACLIWSIGFLWASFVFLIPTLKGIYAVRYFTKYPAVNIPILIIYGLAILLLSRRYLKKTEHKIVEAIKLSITFFIVNFILDAVIYIGISGESYFFTYATVWVSYLMLIGVPWLTGFEQLTFPDLVI